MNAGKNLKTLKTNTSEFLIRLLLPFVWACIILWLSLTPTPPQLPGVLGWDKLLHAGAYGLLAVLIAQFIVFLNQNLDRACWYAAFIAICLGALLEILQLLTQTGRTAEWWDLFADVVGVFLCCVIFRHVSGLVCQPNEHSDTNNG
jgi:VanZ family protein